MKPSLAVISISLSVAMLSACSAHNSEPAASHQAAAAPAKAPKVFNNAPAGSPLARITEGMSDNDVIRVLGEPTKTRNYMTGKSFIPGYVGTDTTREEFLYHGLGRITLSRNQYTHGLKVIHVEYDPGA